MVPDQPSGLVDPDRISPTQDVIAWITIRCIGGGVEFRLLVNTRLHIHTFQPAYVSFFDIISYWHRACNTFRQAQHYRDGYVTQYQRFAILYYGHCRTEKSCWFQEVKIVPAVGT